MNAENTGTLDALVQDKIDGDADFQSTLAGLSDDDKNAAIETKRAEVREAEFADARKAKELADNYKIRAEKAEKELKEAKPPKPGDTAAPAEPALSTADLYALMTAQVPQEDVEEVQKAAKLLGKPISETLQDETFKSILKTRAEHRASAAAANVRPVRPGTSQTSDDQLLKDASEGKIPDKGSAEAEKLFWARRGGKKQ